MFKPCPFCGELPTAGKSPEWRDDNRYVALDVLCCVTITATLGWRYARERSDAVLMRELLASLAEKWNTRHGEASSGMTTGAKHAYMEAAGFTVTCESPLEVSDNAGSSATGLCAKYFIDAFIDDHES